MSSSRLGPHFAYDEPNRSERDEIDGEVLDEPAEVREATIRNLVGCDGREPAVHFEPDPKVDETQQGYLLPSLLYNSRDCHRGRGSCRRLGEVPIRSSRQLHSSGVARPVVGDEGRQIKLRRSLRRSVAFKMTPPPRHRMD